MKNSTENGIKSSVASIGLEVKVKLTMKGTDSSELMVTILLKPIRSEMVPPK